MANAVNGLIYGDNGYSGAELAQIAQSMYGTPGEPLESISEEQLAFLLDYLVPSNYSLRYHTLKGGAPYALSVPNRDYTKAVMHRPWQRQMLDDDYPRIAIMKARQLGLTEVGVAKMIHWADVHSYAGVTCVYAFPTLTQLNSFTQMRLDTVLGRGYYNEIQDPDINSQRLKKIRNSYINFVTSSSNKTIEGVAGDYFSLDEFDRVPVTAYLSAQNALKSSRFKRMQLWSTPKILLWAL